jgi:energy-coupling factor transporter ATP-binding protein EcfA2
LAQSDVDTVLKAIGYSHAPNLAGIASAIDPQRPRLASVRVRSYRSVGELEITELPSPLVIVGPNNSGKTNLLRAIELLFSNPGHGTTYDRERDLTFGASDRQRTGLSATFEIDASSYLATRFGDLMRLAGGEKPRSKDGTIELTLSIEFLLRRVSMRLRPLGLAAPAGSEEFIELERRLIDEILATFSVHYIPSVLVRTASRVIRPQVELLERELASISSGITSVLRDIGIGTLETQLTLPDGSLDRLLESGFDLHVSDPNSTSIFEKGHGIQSLVLLASLLWITEDDDRLGKTSVWLLEEPESYLHPELARGCRQLLDRLASVAPVVVTTHSLAFVPSSASNVVGIQLREGTSELETYSSYRSATRRIRQSLGVRFADFLQFDDFNIVVEGETDVTWLRWYLDNHYVPTGELDISMATIVAQGGAQHVRSFLEWSLAILRKECRLVALLDGDTEGLDVYKSLKRLEIFKSLSVSDHIIIGRRGFAIEGLMPDEWILELYELEPDLFETVVQDAQGEIIDLAVVGSEKSRYFEVMSSWADQAADNSWSIRLQSVVETIERCFERQEILP